MEFTNPTTKQEMYDTLRELYMYYRVRRDIYEEPELVELNLEPLSFLPLSQGELEEKARNLLLGAQAKEIQEKRNTLFNRKSSLQSKLENVEKNILEFTATTEETYAKSKKELKAKGLKNGLGDSNLILKELLQLEENKNTKILNYATKCLEDKSEILAEIEVVENELMNVEDSLYEIHQGQIQSKIVELNDEQQKIEREVFKYNNEVSEKLQKAQNTNVKTTASLKMKYLEIKAQPVSHDELVELGYYKKVVDCATAYYNTLPPSYAYNDIKNEVALSIYLDEFYEYITYAYKSQLEVENG